MYILLRVDKDKDYVFLHDTTIVMPDCCLIEHVTGNLWVSGSIPTMENGKHEPNIHPVAQWVP